MIGGAHPLGELEDVYLGMPVSELLEARPKARQLEDFLYGEDAAPYQVRYSFPLRVPFGPEPRLKVVGALQAFGEEPPARAAWQSLVAGLETALGAPTRCRRTTSSSVRADAVLWERPDGLIITSSLNRELTVEGEGAFVVVLTVEQPAGDVADEEERTIVACDEDG